MPAVRTGWPRPATRRSARRVGPLGRLLTDRPRGARWAGRQGLRRGALAVLLAAVTVACTSGADWRGAPGWSSRISDCLDPSGSPAGDIRRHSAAIQHAGLCYRRQEVREGAFVWVFHILEHRREHRRAPAGPFWVLPHDDEDTAFAAGLHAVVTYGGGLLAVDSDGRRAFRGQDPNRNFSGSVAESGLCPAQRYPAPGYTAAILAHYRGRGGPYLALHNNHDGWRGSGGLGSISLHRSDRWLFGYPGQAQSGPLRDADNLVFIAGTGPPWADAAVRREIGRLTAAGLNLVYKQVTASSFDCSMSDYIARHRLGSYYNIEAEHGQLAAQIEMIDRLMGVLGVAPLRRGAVRPVAIGPAAGD